MAVCECVYVVFDNVLNRAGVWGTRGLFAAVDKVSTLPREHYNKMGVCACVRA
jgi:hypothetical protein